MNVFVQGKNIKGIELITVSDVATVSELVKIAQQVGLTQEQPIFVFVEGEEERAKYPVTNGEDKKLTDIGIGQHARVHLHTDKKIHVTVNYGGGSKQHPFPPSETVAAIRKWAIEKFAIDPAQAAEHVLQLCKTDTCPDPDLHVGGLATGHPSAVCFDLVPKHRHQG